MQPSRSASKRLADVILGEPVEHFIAARRAEGRSHRLIARDLRESTGGEVDVTEATLRNWMSDVAADVWGEAKPGAEAVSA